MKKWKHLIYLSVALGMLIYAVPRLTIGEGLSLPTVFGVVWILFALTIIAAHLHRIIGVDDVQEEELKQVRALARNRREQWLHRRINPTRTNSK